VMTEDFFEEPLKTVFRTIKRRWQQWQETASRSAEDREAPPTRRPRRALPWYQSPLGYVLLGLGLSGLVGLVCLLVLLGRGKDDGTASAPPPGPGTGKSEGKPADPFGPKSLPGLVAYWPLDEARGQEANDASGNGSLGRIHGGEWLQGVKG